MQSALGVPVIPFDDGTEDGMVDGLFELPDGQLGAVEEIQFRKQNRDGIQFGAVGTPGTPGAQRVLILRNRPQLGRSFR